MLLISDKNDLRTKFYESARLPVTYDVIDTGINLSSMEVKLDDRLRLGVAFTRGLYAYLGQMQYLKGKSFSINDEDINYEPIRVFIDKGGNIYLGKVDCDEEIIKSIVFYISFYVKGISNMILDNIKFNLSRITSFNNINLHDIKVDLVAKTITYTYSIKVKAKAMKIGLKNAVTLPQGGVENKIDTFNLSKILYGTAKRSQEKYEKYIDEEA